MCLLMFVMSADVSNLMLVFLFVYTESIASAADGITFDAAPAVSIPAV